MEREEAIKVVESAKTKVGLSKWSLDDIIKFYNRLGPNRNEINIVTPGEYFPWIDIIASIVEHHVEAHYIESECPKCGTNLFQMNFWSPPYTWKKLYGRAGVMNLCLNCPSQLFFALKIMN